ncbi:hypothetical protein [Parasphingorhabdus pacifica]
MMFRSVSALLAVGALALGASASSAAAGESSAGSEKQSGEVIVFTVDFAPVTKFPSPEGCNTLPTGTHVVVNNTDSEVRIYADPNCFGPSLRLDPDYAAHELPAFGAFSA